MEAPYIGGTGLPAHLPSTADLKVNKAKSVPNGRLAGSVRLAELISHGSVVQVLIASARDSRPLSVNVIRFELDHSSRPLASLFFQASQAFFSRVNIASVDASAAA